MRHILFLRLLCLFAAASPAVSFAGDWPQFLGPNRNGVAEGETLPATMPKTFSPVWKEGIGTGFAGPIVVGGKVIVFHRVDDNERLQAFDAATGKSLWKADFPASYRGGVNPDNGPRCVPVAAGDAVIVFGAAADLHCVSLADGKPRWSRALGVDYEADEGYFGAGSTPIVLSNQVLVNLGGRNAGLIGVALDTGKTVWNRTDENASYSSPVPWKGQALFVTRYNALLVEPTKGVATTLAPFGKRGPTVNAAAPLVIGDDHLFLTASYGIGALYGNLDGNKFTKLWSNDDTLSSQYVTPVELDGVLYGIHGREDVGVGELRAVEAKTGRVLWAEEGFGIGHLVRAKDKILLLKATGELVLFAAEQKKYQQLGSLKVAQGEGVTRPLPALSGGKLFFRTSTFNGGEVFCMDLIK